LLGAGRNDESGDFTKGAGLDAAQSANLLNLLVLGRPVDDITDKPVVEHDDEVSTSLQGGAMRRFRRTNEKYVEHLAAGLKNNPVSAEGVQELVAIESHLRAAGYGTRRVAIDLSVVRGLEYYTGPVFEAELTFPVVNEEGQTVRFGSVAGGGRYDGLVGRFRGEPVPATGFSIGVSRLLSALQIVKSPIALGTDEVGPVVVLVMDRDRVADYQNLVAQLRAANIPAEMYLGSSGMKAQMKYADRRRAPCAVIQGTDERERGEVQIKDLLEGAERARDADAASNAEYRAQRLAQVSVPTSQMVEEVRRILSGRGVQD
jgi:histidyl-tRNA synthetase